MKLALMILGAIVAVYLVAVASCALSARAMYKGWK